MTAVRDAADLAAYRVWFNDLAVMRGLGVVCVELEPGRAVSVLEVEPRHRNPSGPVNGGYLLAAADVTAGVAVAATGGPAAESSTTDLSMHFLEAVVTGPARIEAEVVRRGRRNVVPSVRILDGAGRLCAIATGTWVLLPGPAA